MVEAKNKKRRLSFVRITFGFSFVNEPRKVYYRKIESEGGNLSDAMNAMIQKNGSEMGLEESLCLIEEFQNVLKNLNLNVQKRNKGKDYETKNKINVKKSST